jgi:hypothetical protein
VGVRLRLRSAYISVVLNVEKPGFWDFGVAGCDEKQDLDPRLLEEVGDLLLTTVVVQRKILMVVV